VMCGITKPTNPMVPQSATKCQLLMLSIK
jgi:hypothetical protein